MKKEILKAYINKDNYSCVLINNDKVLMTSFEKGVAPLYNFIREENRVPEGKIEMGDKIIGRAVAFLAAYLGVSYIYTKTISKTALDVLEKYDITVDYEQIVPYILNKNKDGQCPMEMLLAGVHDATEALNAIISFKNER